MTVQRSVHLTIDEDLLREVDETRGDVPRNVWVRRAISDRLARPELPAPEVPIVIPPPVPAEMGATAPPPPIPGRCTHPKAKRQVFTWGSMCGVCNTRL